MCTSSSGDSGGDGGASSTPFIATWDGKRFNLENDFLFSKPRTNTSVHFSVAKRMYEEKIDQGDKYLIQNRVEPLGNKFIFQIREIEPEVSYIDSLQISSFVRNTDFRYFVTSDHKDLLCIEKQNLKGSDVKQSAVFNNNVDISNEVRSRFESVCIHASVAPSFIQELEKGDFVEINGVLTGAEGEPYLLLESKYRDWTIGEIFKERKSILQDVELAQFRTLGNWLRSPVKMLSLALIFALSFVIGFSQKRDEENHESILSQAFDINEARADVVASDSGPYTGTKSLLISYYSNNGSFKNIEVVEPRYFQASSYLIKIPREAISNDTVRIKITATKKHHVTCARLIYPDKMALSSVQTENLELSKAYHRRTKEIVTDKLIQQDKNYLVTWPGDIVDLEFSLPETQRGNLGFVLEAHGFYSAASREIQKKIGDWTSRLDPESAAFLQEVHTLNSSKHKLTINV